MQFNYTPPPTCRAMMLSTALVRCIIGPLGSGKTTCCLFELFRRAAGQTPDSEGVRKTRFAIIRNTLQQLKSTVLPDIQAFFGPLARWKVSESTIHFQFSLPDGTRVKSEWLLIPLENPEDIRRLLSLQLTGAFIEEFREVDYTIVPSLLGRVGRYPSLGVKPTWQGIVASSNPFPVGSAWYDSLVVEQPRGWALFKQPGGRSEAAENVENLPDDYYERLMEGVSPQFVKVFVDGDYGPDTSGQAVFGDTFNWEYHTRPHLPVMPNHTFCIGMDLDRNPAAVICQMTPLGQLFVHKEVFAEGVGLEIFLAQHLTPIMYNHFPGKAYVIGDPSGVRRSSLSEESSFDCLRRMGYEAVPGPTNAIDPRLRSVEALLQAQIAGEAALQINRNECPTLSRAMVSAYKFKRLNGGQLDPKPEKKHPWSDVADALEYASFAGSAAMMGRPIRSLTGRPVRPSRPPVSAAGWT